MALDLADVSDCFHRMTIRTSLGSWLCLPQEAAGEIDMVGVDLGGWPLDFPCPAMFPMGLSWSVHLCQCSGGLCSNVPRGLSGVPW